MQINFFEEYPTAENMAKLALIDWPSTILLATPSLKDFESIKSTYAEKHPHLTFGWWPIVPGSYWVSVFSDPYELDKLFKEITSKKQTVELSVLIDLELPLKNYIYLKNIFYIRKNKKKIENFLTQSPFYNLKIYTAEYPAPNFFFRKLWQFFGISPTFSFKHTKLIMFYSSVGKKSMGEKIWSKVRRFENNFALSNLRRVGFGLGTIATGVFENEPILPAQDLDQDLKWAKESSAKEVFIFRLGGLDANYLSVIKRHLV